MHQAATGTTPGDAWAHTGKGPGTAKCRWLGPCTEPSLDRSIQGPAACAGVSPVPMPGPSSSSCLHARVTDISKPGCWGDPQPCPRVGPCRRDSSARNAPECQQAPAPASVVQHSASIWHSTAQPWATRDIHPLAPVMPCHPAGITAKFVAREQDAAPPRRHGEAVLLLQGANFHHP